MKVAPLCVFATVLLSGCGGIEAGRKDGAIGGVGLEDSCGAAYSVDPEISAGEYETVAEESAEARRSGSNDTIFRARFTYDGIQGGGEEKEDGRLAISAERFRAVLRRKSGGDAEWTSCFVSAERIRGAFSLHAGSFFPDLAEGLIAGADAPSVFSSAFPAGARGRIVQNTSAYGRAIVGGAAEAHCGFLGAVAFAGRERILRAGRIRLGESIVAGGRFEARVRSVTGGISMMGIPPAPRRVHVGIDARVEQGPLVAAVEAARCPSRSISLCVAVSARREGARIGAMLHSVPAGGCPFGAAGGTPLSSTSSYGGATVMAERRIGRRVAVRAAFERAVRSDDSQRRERTTARAEIERKGRCVRLKLSGATTESRETPLLPFPAPGTLEIATSRSCGMLVNFAPSSRISMRLALKGVGESDGGKGILVSPMLRGRTKGSSLAGTLAWTAYRVKGDSPSCYYYEPSLEGVYPWKYAPGGLGVITFVIVYKYNKIKALYKVVFDGGLAPVASVQASLRF